MEPKEQAYAVEIDTSWYKVVNVRSGETYFTMASTPLQAAIQVTTLWSEHIPVVLVERY